MSRIGFSSVRGAVIGALLALAVGGGAYALGSGGSGTITVCVHKKGGGLYRAGTCQAGDSKLSWSRAGQPGIDGTTIAARARGTGPAPTTGSEQNTTMTGNTWTQGANELDTIVGQVTVQEPSQADCNPGGMIGFGNLLGNVLVDGKVVSSVYLLAPSTAQTQTVGLISTPNLFEPGVATKHTLTAQFDDTCTGSGHFDVQKVAVDVEAAR